MMEIETPKIEVTENEDRCYAKIVAEPLEKGFGLTLGNALRRTLLASLPGAAAQGIKFVSGDVKHEFSTVAGIKEDVTEIILNLKTVAFKTATTQPDFKKVLKLAVNGPAVVTAGDIARDSEVEVLNPDAYICTIDKGGVLDMEITVGRGRGYKGAENNKTDEIDYIAIDSIYTPVKKVSYNVDSTRVGQNTDYDKLTLEVWTNGAFSGKEIISLAAQILGEHINLFSLSNVLEDTILKPSQAGQEMIKQAVADNKLTGIVVCSCSPRMHEATFRKTAAAAGLNPYMVEIANIREQCSWVHKEMPIGTEKAIILAKAAVAKVNLNAPLTPGESPVTKRALVIGGGIAGIQTALDIADAGFPVDIVETKPTIGGKMAQLDKTFPTLDCAACILTPKMVDVAQNEKIRIFSYSEVTDVKGFVGNFDVTIKRKARYVKEDVCTGCGACTEKCPQKKVPNEFNLGMDNRRAIYIPFAQAVPKVATIDPNYCTMLKTGKCGVCSKVCTAGAIDYKAKDEFVEEKYGAIVVATGFNPISMEKFDEFAYSQSKDVITSLELERLMNAAGPTGGTLLRPSDHEHPHTIVLVQCVGSRCSACAEKGKEYCSKICCMYTAKHAMLIRDKYPDTDVYVFYIDVRTPGKNFDEFYRRAVEEYGVHYIKGMVGKVTPEGKKLHVQASDLLDNKQLHIDADLVVLAAAIEPDKSARPLATMLTASMDTNDFFTEAHPKLRPVESPTAGVFLSGTCQGPKDIPETVSQAGAAASKVIGLLCKDKLTGNPCIAHSDEMMCNGCSTCEKVCPYGAITYVEKEFRMPDRTTKVRRVASVNEAVCQGCGACTVACMSGAMDLRGFRNKQIMAEVDAICK